MIRIRMIRLFSLIGFLFMSLLSKWHKKMQLRKTVPEITPLDPASIPKFVNKLEKPPVYVPVEVCNLFTGEVLKHRYFVDICEFKQQILPPGFPKTRVLGYGGVVRRSSRSRTVYSKSTPGASFETVRGIPASVTWFNKLKKPGMFPVDPTLHWANPNDMPMMPPTPWPPFPPGFSSAQKPIPVVTHLHGGEVQSVYDGHPEAWFAHDGKTGKEYVTRTYTYPNSQESATLWYHDHALGITRLNVYAGLAGFYLLSDPRSHLDNPRPYKKDFLPRGEYEIPLIIQDRSFNSDGSLCFNTLGISKDAHPYWNPEFFGNTITVNGKVWPNLNVERRQYRLRLLNGSNARFYNLSFSNAQTFVQIGSDGGYLPKPVELESVLIAPAERIDILIDFSALNPGTSVILQNDAPAPFPGGNRPDPVTTGQVMRFTVPENSPEPVIPETLPETLNYIPSLVPDVPSRTVVLYEVEGAYGPLEVLLDGQKWSSAISEMPIVGSTEDWLIVNLTADTHPIHLHLIQFQVINRQKLNTDKYANDWIALNGIPPLTHPTIALTVGGEYLVGDPVPPPANETGWKDTVRADSGEVIRIRVRFAPQDAPISMTAPGINLFPFNPSCGPGYVWHCHILDHEDNEMMRPFTVGEKH